MSYEAQVTFFGKDGLAVGDEVVTANRSWVLNDTGELKFRVPINKIDQHEYKYEKGNWVLVEQDNLPDWVGFIDVPEPWGQQAVVMYAKSAEELFKIFPAQRQRVKATPGSIYRTLITHINEWGKSLLEEGDIFGGGTARKYNLNPGVQCIDFIDRMVNKYGNSFDVTPEVVNGRLVLKANWYKTKRTVVDFALSEGINLVEGTVELEYEGPIWNHIIGFSNHATWKSKKVFEVWDDTSISKYGRRALGLAVPSESKTTVERQAKNFLKFHKEPRHRLDAYAIDTINTFSYLETGNVVDIDFVNAGLENGELGVSLQAEIEEVIYDHERNAAQLTLFEIREEEE